MECVPGLLLEFLETLPKKDEHTRLSFLLLSGFAEGCQLRCGEEFLAKLPEYLGVRYGGCLVKGDNFGIRMLDDEKQKQSQNRIRRWANCLRRETGFSVRKQRNLLTRNIFPCPCAG